MASSRFRGDREDKVFVLNFVEGEGVIDEENPYICASHSEMSLRERYDYERKQFLEL